MKFWLIAVTFLFLIILITAMSISYFVYKNLYSKELSLRLSPLVEDVVKYPSKKKYWLLGDSRISQWKIPDSIISNSDICNLGIEGQTTAQVLYRMELYYKENAPNYLFLQVGINDLKAIGLFPNKEGEIIDKCKNNIKQILFECIEHEVTPVFLTIIPPGETELFRRLIWSHAINKAVFVVNEEIKKYAKERNILVLDVYSLLVGNEYNLRSDFQKDCLHMNQKGYDILNQNVLQLKKTLPIN